ncbi:hypothetical protein D3C72_1658820 [compost metagenome]
MGGQGRGFPTVQPLAPCCQRRRRRHAGKRAGIGAGLGACGGTCRLTRRIVLRARLAQQEQAAPSLAKDHRRGQPQHGQHHQQRAGPAQQVGRQPSQRMPHGAAGALAFGRRQGLQRGAGAQHQQRTQPHPQRATTKRPAVAGKRARCCAPCQRQQPEGRQSEPAQTHDEYENVKTTGSDCSGSERPGWRQSRPIAKNQRLL